MHEERNMKKFFWYFISVCVVIFFLQTINTKVYIRNKLDYCIGVQEIKVNSLKESVVAYETLFDIYGFKKEYGWTDELKEKVNESGDEYLLASIYYMAKNNSQNIRMGELNFYPKFTAKLKDRVKAYNYAHDTYLLYADPGLTCGMEQNILIEKRGMNKEEIYEEIIKSSVKVEWIAEIQNNKHEFIGGDRQKTQITIKTAVEQFENTPTRQGDGSPVCNSFGRQKGTYMFCQLVVPCVPGIPTATVQTSPTPTVWTETEPK